MRKNKRRIYAMIATQTVNFMGFKTLAMSIK